jgi:hypothetical protein
MFKMRFDDFVAVPASDHCRAAFRAGFMTINTNVLLGRTLH